MSSIADEFAPPQDSEAANAVADFDSNTSSASLPEAQPGPIAPAPEPQPAPEPAAQEAADEPTSAEAPESEKHAPRRSTVREKVTFLSAARPAEQEQTPPAAEAAPTPASQAEPAPMPETAPPPEESAAEPAAPRKAGWWSRRFGRSE